MCPSLAPFDQEGRGTGLAAAVVLARLLRPRRHLRLVEVLAGINDRARRAIESRHALAGQLAVEKLHGCGIEPAGLNPQTRHGRDEANQASNSWDEHVPWRIQADPVD